MANTPNLRTRRMSLRNEGAAVVNLVHGGSNFARGGAPTRVDAWSPNRGRDGRHHRWRRPMGAGWGFRGGEPFATQTNYWFLALQFALKRAGLELQSRVIVRFAISLEYVWGQGCSSSWSLHQPNRTGGCCEPPRVSWCVRGYRRRCPIVLPGGLPVKPAVTATRLSVEGRRRGGVDQLAKAHAMPVGAKIAD